MYGISMALFGDEDFETVCARCSEAGFVDLELLADHGASSLVRENPRAARRILERYGLRLRVGHSPIGEHNAGDLDEQKRKEAVEAVSSAFEPMAAVGATYVVVHSNNYGDYSDQMRDASKAQSCRSLEEYSRQAERVGLKLAVENLNLSGMPRPGCTMAELLEMTAGLGSHVGLCLDAGHACNNKIDAATEVWAAGDRLFTLHIHDNDAEFDRHWVPGTGKVDWESFIKALDEVAFTGPRTLELTANEGQTAVDVLHEARKCVAWFEDIAGR